jgi:hypothetical protein
MHFQTEQGFRVVPDPGSNMLLLTGSKGALEEAIAVLREIDRPTRSVHVEVFIVEQSAKSKALDEAELRGTVGDVRTKIHDLQQKGAISNVKTVELTALTGQSTKTQVSENKPYTTGVSVMGRGNRGGAGAGGGPNSGGFGGRGGAGGFGGGSGGSNAGAGGSQGGPAAGGFGGGTTTRSISYRNVGTSVQVKPEVDIDGHVTLELHLEDSGMRAAGSDDRGEDQGSAGSAAEFTLFNLDSHLKVRSGQVVLAESTKAGQTRVIVLVSANPD